MPSGLFLELVQASRLQFVLTDAASTLGRSTKCEFVLNHPTISRMHAKLFRRDEGFAVLDLDSRNGTFVDEERVKTTEICSGQRLRFGGLTFAVRIEELEEWDEITESCSTPPEGPRSLLCDAPGALSKGQQRIFEQLLTGGTEKTIARRLDLSPHTVHNHVQAIFRMLQVHSKAELVAKCLARPTENIRF